MKADKILKKHEDANEMHFYQADREWIIEAMKEFAKIHVKAQQKAIIKNAKIIDDPNSYTGNTGSEYPPEQIISEDSILNAYSLNLIK